MRPIVYWILATMIALGSTSAFAQSSGESSSFGPRNTFLVSGYAFVNAVNPEDGKSSFGTGFSPIFLWKSQDKLLFESELEFEQEDGATEVTLEYAQIWWLASDYLMLGAGKFLNPNNHFMERLHPTWINKLPTMPFGVSGHGGVQLLAGTQLGAQLRGGMPLGSGKFTYSVYVSNGPSLNAEEDHEEDPAMTSVPGPRASAASEEEEAGHGVSSPGTLNFSNTSDNNDDKAYGGRIAFLPVPELEVGYGFETAQAGDDGTEFSNVRTLNHSADLSYVRTSKALKGRVDLRGQFIFLDVDNPDAHPLEFENESVAWYGQVAFQPTNVGNSILSNTEIVFRYDQIDLPEDAPLNEDRSRISVGLGYWLTPSAVVKVAFEAVTTDHEDGDETLNTIIAQMTMGF